jgi:dephospho-CoA kinase
VARTTLKIGLTGGIASGKTAVSRLFASYGVPIIDSDDIARDLLAPGRPLTAQVFARFGADLQRADGSLDRAQLRARVFADPRARGDLEQLLHPAIAARAQQLGEAAAGPYQIYVVPLLVEAGLRARYDRVLVVDCPESLQLTRLLARDGIDPALARSMLEAQAPRALRLAAADDLIRNEGGLEALAPQVAALHGRYLALAAALPHA